MGLGLVSSKTPTHSCPLTHTHAFSRTHEHTPSARRPHPLPTTVPPTPFAPRSTQATFLVSSAFGLVGLVITMIFLPDTTGLSLDELDRLVRGVQGRATGLQGVGECTAAGMGIGPENMYRETASHHRP